MHHYVVLLNFC